MLGELPTHVHRMTNGLTVVVREDPTAPVVAIVTRVEAGYLDEADPVAGISHVLEHMYFKGTTRRGPGDMARETKAAGGQVNAGTIYDHTSYYTVLPASALELGLDIHSDALISSTIDADELRRELLVIIQEAKRKLDNPRAVAQETLYETMFDAHRIRRWRIGTEDALARLTRDDVLRFYREQYRPSNVVLSVAGDVDADHIFDLVQRYYSAMPAGEPPRDRGPDEPERRGFRFRELTGDIVRTHIEWGWRTPGSLDPDRAPLDLLAAVLGEGRASWLYRDVRDAGLVARIGAQNYTAGAIGVLDIAAELEAADTEAALHAIGAVVERLRTSPATLAELDRAKIMIEARLLRRLETAQGQANLLADWQALGDWRLLDEYASRVAAATPEQLRLVAERWLEPELGSVLVYRPTGTAPVDIGPDSLAGVSGRAGRDREGDAAGPASPRRGEEQGPRVTPVQPLADDGDDDVEDERRAGAAPVRIEDGVHFYDVSGIPVAVEPRPSSQLVSMAVVCRGGALDETRANAGITTLLGRASVKGTVRRTGARLAEESEALGGVIRASVSADTVQWSLSVPSRHLERGFELLADAAFAPRFPHDDVERERKNLLSDLDRLRDDMARYPLRLLLNAAFDGHPYGFSVEEAETAARELSVADLDAWHDRLVTRGDTWVFIVGGIDANRAVDAAAGHLRRLAPRERTAGVDEADGRVRPAWPSQSRVRAAARDKAQTALAVGFPGPAAADAELYALTVASSAISGLGGRLFEELRSQRSLAYTVSAYPISRWLSGTFVGYIATSPEREAEARDRLIEEIGALRDWPLAAEDVERAKRYAIGSWQIRRQRNDNHLSDLATALLLGEGMERIRCFEERIAAVTPTAIQAAAERYLDPSLVAEGIVRGRNDRE